MKSRNTEKTNNKTNWFEFFSKHNVDYKPCVYHEEISKCTDGTYQINTDFSAHTITGTTDDIIAALRAITTNKDLADQMQKDTTRNFESMPELSVSKINNMIKTYEENANTAVTNNIHAEEEKYNCCRIF